MPSNLPNQQDAFAFICGTHDIDRINCSNSTILATYQGKHKDPYADGHLKALQYIFTELVDKMHFPAKNIQSLTNSFKSNLALNWLRELHFIMLTPVVVDPLFDTDRQSLEITSNAPRQNELGVYRNRIASNSFSLAPTPDLIPKILHNWLIEITTLHDKVKGKMESAFGITREIAHELDETAYKSLLLISTVQPFACCNNRLGRLVENALRLQWHLPWKVTTKGHSYEKFIDDLEDFQKSDLHQVIKEAQSIRW